ASITFSIALRRFTSSSSLISFSLSRVVLATNSSDGASPEAFRRSAGSSWRNALLDLRQAPLHLSLREVVVARVNRFELAAVDRNARFRQQTHLAAQGNELPEDLLDGRAVVFAEIGDGFVIRKEPSRQPHHFQIAASL